MAETTNETDVMGGLYRETDPAKRDCLHYPIRSIEAATASIARAARAALGCIDADFGTEYQLESRILLESS